MTAHPSARADALIVGGGPAGTATALRLARAGHRVVVIERQRTAVPPAAAGLLNPRALAAFHRLDVELDDGHRVPQVRLTAHGSSNLVEWPTHPLLPDHGLVTNALGETLASAATKAGVVMLYDHTATAPIIDRGFVRGALVTAPDGTDFEARAEYTVIADGANSWFGRALGTFREPTWPYGLAHHGAFRSTMHDSTAIDLVLDLRDRSGTPISGHGWMYPAGDGTVTIGVVLMSTSASFQVISTANLFARFVAANGPGWGVDGEAIDPPNGRRLPVGLSVGPAAGPTYLLIGDAVGAANPLSRTGIEGALETAEAAAVVLDDAIRTGDAAHLQRYPQLLQERYGSFYKVARLTSRLLGQPSVARRAERAVVRRRSVAEAYLRITNDALRSGTQVGAPEAAYRVGRSLSSIAPDA